MCDWNHNWTGNAYTPQCHAPCTRSTLSGHRFCDQHFAEHEADMALGLGERLLEGDTYLAGSVLYAIRNLRQHLDRLEAAAKAAEAEAVS